jgi:Spy/CpxP family protein refolding chaperone
MEETMQGLRRLTPAAIGALTVVVVVAMAAAGMARAANVHHAGHAGECGEYKYWHAGKCVDARDKSEKPWTSAVY